MADFITPFYVHSNTTNTHDCACLMVTHADSYKAGTEFPMSVYVYIYFQYESKNSKYCIMNYVPKPKCLALAGSCNCAIIGTVKELIISVHIPM